MNEKLLPIELEYEPLLDVDPGIVIDSLETEVLTDVLKDSGAEVLADSDADSSMSEAESEVETDWLCWILNCSTMLTMILESRLIQMLRPTRMSKLT